MGFWNDYNQELTGVVFDEPINYEEALKRLTGGGKPSPPFQGGQNPFVSPAQTSPEFKKKLEDAQKLAGLGQAKGNLSLSYLMEAYKKGLITEEEFRSRLATGETPLNKHDQDILLGIAAKQPADLSISQLGNAKQKGLMNDEQIRDRLNKSGYTEEDQRVLLSLIDEQAKSDLNLSQMSQAVQKGLMTQDDMAQRLAKAGYSQEDAQILQGLVAKDQKEAAAPKSFGLSTLSELYKAGKINGLEFISKLTSAGGEGSQAEAGKQRGDLSYNVQDAYKVRDLLDKEVADERAKEAARLQKEQAGAAKDAAREAERKAKEAQDLRNTQTRESITRNKQEPQTYSDQVNGYLENFHRNFLTQLKESNLGAQATNWLMNNQDLVLNQHLGGGRTPGAALSGASLMNIYESQRGMARKQGETHQAEISAQKIG